MDRINREIGMRMAYGRRLAGLSQAQMATRMSEHGITTSRHYARTSRRRLDQAVCTLNTGPGHAKAPTRP
jgi:hypothetical protein